MSEYEPCCLADAVCGVTAFGGVCSELQTERLDGECADYNELGVVLPACCLPDGMCGLRLPNTAGCVSASSIVLPISELACSGLEDQDASSE